MILPCLLQIVLVRRGHEGKTYSDHEAVRGLGRQTYLEHEAVMGALKATFTKNMQQTGEALKVKPTWIMQSV